MSDNEMPLQVIYVINEKGLQIGWGLDRDLAKSGLIPVCSKETLTLKMCEGMSEEAYVDSLVRTFFDGPLSADLKIPNGYPYELFKDSENKVITRGTLRNKEI